MSQERLDFQYFLSIAGRLYCGLLSFRDREQSDRHNQDAAHLREFSASINNRYAAGTITDEQRRREWTQWLDQAMAFRVKWGDNFVLPDIRLAIYDAQDNIGTGRVSLPPLQSPSARPGTERGALAYELRGDINTSDASSLINQEFYSIAQVRSTHIRRRTNNIH